MMLAALPGQVGDGGVVKTVGDAQVQLLVLKSPIKTYVASLTGPKECEITGVTMTPDYKAIFINVQHPGEDSKSFDAPSSHWPATQTDMNK